jgi:deoxyxylulose-5-phosphate synthase
LFYAFFVRDKLPADLRALKVEDLQEVADEFGKFIIDTCSQRRRALLVPRSGGRTGVAMHYVFDTPQRQAGLGRRPPGVCS